MVVTYTGVETVQQYGVNVLDLKLYTHLGVVFVMLYFHTLHPISSHTKWNGKNN